MKFNTSQEGLLTLYKPYQAALLEHIWKINTRAQERIGITSGQAHKHLMEAGKEELKISRASVIVFLNDMVEKRILEYESKSGKGGYHRVYYPKMTREEFRQYVTDLIMEKLKTL